MAKKFLTFICLLCVFLMACSNQATSENRTQTVVNTQSVSDVVSNSVSVDSVLSPSTVVDTTNTTDTSQVSNSGIVQNDANAVQALIGDGTEINPNLKLGEMPENVDIDLTTMSNTMIYAEVLNMLTNPSEYIDKTVVMSGFTNIYVDENTKALYYSCIIPDATSCCAQGIEFELANTPLENYPYMGQAIKVVGTFGTYTENDTLYCVLKDAYFVP